MSCFTTGGPGKEQGTNKPPPTRRVWERSKGDTTCPTTSQNPSLWYPSWLNKLCTTRKDSESEWLAKDNPETNPITIKPETASQSRAVLLGSLTLLLSTWAPFPNKISCFFSACVSLDNTFTSARSWALEGFPLPAIELDNNLYWEGSAETCPFIRGWWNYKFTHISSGREFGIIYQIIDVFRFRTVLILRISLQIHLNT